MKKLIIAAALAAASISATAADVTIRGGHNFDTAQNNMGISVGTQFHGVGVEAGFDRTTSGELFNRWTVGANYEITKVMGATIAAHGGFGWIDRNLSSDGAAVLVGASVSYPVTKAVSAVLSYQYQKGQQRVEDLDGSLVQLGMRVKF